MAEVVLMPQLGESVTEGTIGRWLKKVGDPVEKYESLLEVLTDKVNAEVPAPVGGTVSKILVEEGQTVAVGTPICEITVEGEETGDHSATANTQPAASPSQEDSTPKKAVLPLRPLWRIRRVLVNHYGDGILLRCVGWRWKITLIPIPLPVQGPKAGSLVKIS